MKKNVKKKENKTEIKQESNRYQMAYNRLFEAQPTWKRYAIVDDLKNKNDSGLLVEFVKNVIETAENEEISFDA